MKAYVEADHQYSSDEVELKLLECDKIWRDKFAELEREVKNATAEGHIGLTCQEYVLNLIKRVR